MDGESGFFFYVIRIGVYYIFFFCVSFFCGCFVKGFYEKVIGSGGLFKSDLYWESMFNVIICRMFFYSFGVVCYLMYVLGNVGVDVFFVGLEVFVLLDG